MAAFKGINLLVVYFCVFCFVCLNGLKIGSFGTKKQVYGIHVHVY